MLAAAAIAAPLCEAQQDFSAVELSVLPVQGSVYMIAGAGGNISVQIGDEGVLIVDTQFAPLAPRIMAEIKKLTNRPVRFIVNTHDHPDHVGGNAALAELVAPSSLEPLQMIAHENALARLSNPAPGEAETPPGGLPADSYFTPTKDFHFNGEAVFLYHAPNAHTDGDTIVLFRESDVVSTGDLFTPGGYPFIDRERGGSVQGLIAGLNQILHLTVPAKTQERGTYVIPGHGRICDEADVVEFRDMIVIVRDRVADMIERGMSLRQIQAARPTLDYDTEYVKEGSFVTAAEFVEAVYRSLTEPRFMRVSSLRRACCGVSSSATRARAAATSARAGSVGTRCGTRRPHGLLGIARHGGLALAHGHAAQRRRRERSRQRRRTRRHRRVGPGQGRSGRRRVQGLRRSRVAARAGTPAHPLA